MEVTLYTRVDCPLCDQAKAVLQRAGIAAKEIDIDGDPDLKRKYNDHVPVIFIDGAEAFRHRVNDEQLQAMIAGWRVIDGHHLEKEFRFPDFAGALAFVNRIAPIAEDLNHHPDVLLGWGKVKVMTWSHDAGAITSRDWKLVARIESLKA